MYIVEQTWSATLLTSISWYVKDIEALTPNHLLLSNENICFPYLPLAEEFVVRQSLFPPTQVGENLIWDQVCKGYLPNLINRQKWQSTANDILKVNELVLLIEDTNQREYFKQSRVEETIKSSDVVMLLG